MDRLKHLLRSVPFLAHFFQWFWDIATLSRFKRHHHSLIVKLEQEKGALQHRIDLLEQHHVALRDRISILEQNHSALSESLAPTVEKMVAEQLYYQSLALQQRLDQLGFDASITEPTAAQ